MVDAGHQVEGGRSKNEWFGMWWENNCRRQINDTSVFFALNKPTEHQVT
jgi:hypothetical protein